MNRSSLSLLLFLFIASISTAHAQASLMHCIVDLTSKQVESCQKYADIKDPEFSSHYYASWFDLDGRVVIAPLDPATGSLQLDRQISSRPGLGVVVSNNGPEWSDSSGGFALYFTCRPGPDSGIRLCEAKLDGGGAWLMSQLPESRNLGNPVPMQNPDFPESRLLFNRYVFKDGDWASRGMGAKTIVGDEHTTYRLENDYYRRRRWMPDGEHFVAVTSGKQGSEPGQVLAVNIRSGTEQKVFADRQQRDFPFLFYAPAVGTPTYSVAELYPSHSEIALYTEGRNGSLISAEDTWYRSSTAGRPFPYVYSMEPVVVATRPYLVYAAYQENTNKSVGVVVIEQAAPDQPAAENQITIIGKSRWGEITCKGDPEALPLATPNKLAVYYTDYGPCR
jgi:hypothetical protein